MPKNNKMKKIICVGFMVAMLFAGSGCSNKIETLDSVKESAVQEMTVQESQGTAPVQENVIEESNEVFTSTATSSYETESTTVFTEATTSAIQQETSESTVTTVVTTEKPTEAQTTYTEAVPMHYHTHEVVYGDTWYGISKRYHVDMNDLLAVNNADEDTIIRIGEFINIPSYGYYDDTYDYDNTPDYDIPDVNNYPQYSAGTCIAYQCMTYNNPWNNSWKNIVTSAQYLNGTILYSGDTFSWFSVMGPCDYSQGYIDSDGYAGNQVVQVPGGGICFTSTNLHLCARGAGMEILERHDHSMPVWYAGRGDEASVSYGSWDLKFRNNTGYDVIIYSSTDEYGNLTISMYTM